MSTIIEKGTPVVTLINVFTVDPVKQDELVALLEAATKETMRQRPGFVSANIHRGLDRRHVTNYAQWASREAFEAMLADPVAQRHMKEVTAIAQPAPVLYEVASVHGPEEDRGKAAQMK
jgi:quinol monooxygenase YgiN